MIAEAEPDLPYTCMSCGKPNDYYKWTCEACEDPNGGDGPDD